jgi:hypothetical protein
MILFVCTGVEQMGRSNVTVCTESEKVKRCDVTVCTERENLERCDDTALCVMRGNSWAKLCFCVY